MFRDNGEIVALRYITTDGQIEMCCPCRIIADSPDLLALFIPAGTPYKAAPRQTYAKKYKKECPSHPTNEYTWNKDSLRLMFPGKNHSVFLFWDEIDGNRKFNRYSVIMEESFRRTATGFDTQDHTLGIDITDTLDCNWRGIEEVESKIDYGFYSKELIEAAKAEGEAVIDAISKGTHLCLYGWKEWKPDKEWSVPDFPEGWDTTPIACWERKDWAYGKSM